MVDVSAVRYNLSTRESEGVANHTLHVMHALTVVSVVSVSMYLIGGLPTDLIKGAGTTGPVLAVCLQPLALACTLLEGFQRMLSRMHTN